jgi:hypothetical protein
MDRDFPPPALAPDWVRPVPTKKKPEFLRQAAFFSLYAPFILFFISVIVNGTSSSPAWHHYATVVFAIVYRVTIVAAFVLGVIGFIGGIKHRCVEIYVCAFWGCFFNGALLTIVILSIFGS